MTRTYISAARAWIHTHCGNGRVSFLAHRPQLLRHNLALRKVAGAGADGVCFMIITSASDVPLRQQQRFAGILGWVGGCVPCSRFPDFISFVWFAMALLSPDFHFLLLFSPSARVRVHFNRVVGLGYWNLCFFLFVQIRMSRICVPSIRNRMDVIL